MHSAPPVLTPERIDPMLSIMAEVCLEGVQLSGERLKAAESDEAFERAGRTLQTACRNLRQTIAMKQRFDREQAKLAADARREAEDERREGERVRKAAVFSHQTRVRSHFERILWDEYEDDDAQEIFEDLDERLVELSREDGFLDQPVETLVARLAEEFGIGASPSEAPQERVSDEGSVAASAALNAEDAEDPQSSQSDPGEPTLSANSAYSAVQIDVTPTVAPDPDPPPRPPDPPPEQPYIPPWEKLKPGQVWPGSSGW